VPLSLWRDPKAESLFDATPNRSEVVQRLLEGHLTGALDRLSTGLRDPAVAVLRHLVTSAGTRNIVLEADLLERLRTSENIPDAVGKRALAELSGQSRLVRRQRRNHHPERRERRRVARPGRSRSVPGAAVGRRPREWRSAARFHIDTDR
jgi:hypothetical protein